MIKIVKNREPQKLLHYRKQPFASYENMPKDVRDDLTKHLLKEQGYICAYCMRRIPEERDLPEGVSPVTVEHWFPRNPDNNMDLKQGLDYKNLFAVCSGNRGHEKKSQTCDARKGNEQITVNPCDSNTLCSIGYNSRGYILSSDPVISEDISVRLNLNCESISLPDTRKRVLDELIRDIQTKCKDGDIKHYCEKKLYQLEKSNPKIPYVGIMIWWLNKHLGGPIY